MASGRTEPQKGKDPFTWKHKGQRPEPPLQFSDVLSVLSVLLALCIGAVALAENEQTQHLARRLLDLFSVIFKGCVLSTNG